MARFDDLIPAPLAAPETKSLRRARYGVVVGCAFLSASLLFFGWLRELLGLGALAVFVGSFVFVVLQAWVWLSAKNKADGAFLFRSRERDG